MSDPRLWEIGFDLESLRFHVFDAAAFKAAGCSCSDLKAAGFKYSDLKAAGFDPKSLQSAGYCWLSLIKEFGYDAVASSGCDVSRILRDGPNLYMTLHRHKVDDSTVVANGNEYAEKLPEGWQIADGSADDVARACSIARGLHFSNIDE